MGGRRKPLARFFLPGKEVFNMKSEVKALKAPFLGKKR